MKRLPILIAFLLGFSSLSHADIFDDFKDALIRDDYARLAAIFANTLEYEENGKTSSYTKAEALNKLKTRKNSCSGASISVGHKGSGGGDQFAIISMTCASGIQYRMTVYAKKEGNNLRIAVLHIDKSE